VVLHRTRAQIVRLLRKFDERIDHLGDHPVRTGHEALAEVPDPAKAWWQLNLDAVPRGQVDRIVRMEAEPNTFVSDAVARKTVVEQATGHVQKVGVASPHDDPSEWAGLVPTEGRAVWLNDEASFRVDPEAKAIATETMHRNGDLDMMQERSQAL
jgi:hypothetical protein